MRAVLQFNFFGNGINLYTIFKMFSNMMLLAWALTMFQNVTMKNENYALLLVS